MSGLFLKLGLGDSLSFFLEFIMGGHFVTFIVCIPRRKR